VKKYAKMRKPQKELRARGRGSGRGRPAGDVAVDERAVFSSVLLCSLMHPLMHDEVSVEKCHQGPKSQRREGGKEQ
jgi:hypothetical protein